MTEQPDPALIDSMALRYRHDFGLLDERTKESIRVTMRQLWEEVVGIGFYKAARAAPPQDIGNLEYMGNSVAYIYQKMRAYKSGLDKAWDAMRAAGFPPNGETPLNEAIAKALTARAAQGERVLFWRRDSTEAWQQARMPYSDFYKELEFAYFQRCSDD